MDVTVHEKKVDGSPYSPEEVFRFAIKTRRTSRTSWARLATLDLVLCEALVECADGRRRGVILRRQDCSEAIQQIARIRDGVFWIECELDDDPLVGRCLGMRLCVNPIRLRERLTGNGVVSEEFVVQLSRTVWRESVVPASVGTGESFATPPLTPAPPCWKGALPMRPHQLATLHWMRAQETRFPHSVRYDGNIRIGDTGWYIDTERECLTADPSPREAELRGGICADAPGSGKTATAIALMVGGEEVEVVGAYSSRASLVIVPLNLTSQWLHEIDKFTTGTRVLTLLSARDLRAVDMANVCEDFDIVLTTFNFLRSCKAYVDLVEAAMGGRPRSRASLSAWGRQRNHREPILEAVRWRRVVVDEIHQTFDVARDLRSLQLFDPRCVWGLSGTLVTESDGAQNLYVLLAREKAHHPNLLASLIRNAVRNHAPGAPAVTAVHEVRRVHVTERERRYVDGGRGTEEDFMDVENEVRRLSFVDAMEGDETMEAAHARRQQNEHHQLTSQLDSLHHTICVLERVCSELEEELDGDGDHGLRDTLHQTARDLHIARQRRHDLARRLEGGVRLLLPTTATTESSDIGTKMREIGRLISSFPAAEPIVLFVQWKTMMRGTRTFLRRGEDRRVFTLDGNSHQRTSTLQEHLRGGVLLLCMEDSFAGLHLPHARNIIFAHAIVADVGTVRMLEEQAIARCVREGQTSQVTVHSFMVADSAEERHWTGTHGALTPPPTTGPLEDDSGA